MPHYSSLRLKKHFTGAPSNYTGAETQKTPLGHESQPICPSYSNQFYKGAIQQPEKPGIDGRPPLAFSTGTPSMSRRRKACNRPILDLHVEMPSVASNGQSRSEDDASDISEDEPNTPLSLPFSRAKGSDNPCTPENQHHSAILSPKAPRFANVCHNNNARWIPTPTEGVLPSLSETEVVEFTSTAYSLEEPYLHKSDNNQEIEVSNSTITRPRFKDRALSWLSVPRKYTVTEDIEKAPPLASPLIVYSNTSNRVLAART